MAPEFIKSDTEVAINDLAVACREAADVHETSANGSDDPEVAAALRRLAEARRQAASRLGDYLSEHYEGPNWPEPEKEVFIKAAARVQSAFSINGTATLLSESQTREQDVQDAAVAALGVELPSSMRAEAERLRNDAEAQVAMLAGKLAAEE